MKAINRSGWPICAILSVLLIPIARTSHAANEYCTEKPCFLRATPKTFSKSPGARKGTEFALGKIRLFIPGKLHKVSMPSKNILTVGFDGDKKLTARLVDNDDLVSLLPAASRAGKFSLTAANIPHIIFDLTPEDVEPADTNDKAIWRNMIIRKKLLFGAKSQLKHFESPKLNGYIANGVDGPLAMLSRKEGGAYIELQARRMPLADFEAMIASVDTN